MSVICPICEGNVDWGEGKCPHSIDDIVQTLYLEIKGLSHVAEDQRTSLVAENDTLHKQLDIAVKGLNMARSEVIQYFPPHEYTLAIIDDALAQINRIGKGETK